MGDKQIFFSRLCQLLRRPLWRVEIVWGWTGGGFSFPDALSLFICRQQDLCQIAINFPNIGRLILNGPFPHSTKQLARSHKAFSRRILKSITLENLWNCEITPIYVVSFIGAYFHFLVSIHPIFFKPKIPLFSAFIRWNSTSKIPKFPSAVP